VQAAQLMRFTTEQQDKILSVRAEHLRRLQRCGRGLSYICKVLVLSGHEFDKDDDQAVHLSL